MPFSTLNAISPVDGRYRRHTEPLTPTLSEWGLIRHRVEVEVRYFIDLVELPLPQLADFPSDMKFTLTALYENFEEGDAQRIKDIESTTNHDVKAVEYWIKEEMEKLDLGKWSEFVHFGLTSQDVNNTAIPLSLKRATEDVYLPVLNDVIGKLKDLATEWKSVPMLARTHGQSASPVTVGKEIMVFVERLQIQRDAIETSVYAAKFGGATGGFNAHKVAYPDIDWIDFGNSFVEGNLGLHRSKVTTQVEHYDHLAAWCDALRRAHTVMIDLDRDVWTYISLDYFKQKIIKGEVGSSAMPHKVNPIDFENSEGNFGLANALLGHFAEKLPISRMQRDLTDSTVLRNVGVPLAHAVIALKSLQKGLGKLLINEAAFANDLEAHWAVVSEGVQTILRREGYPKPYETLKALTRTGEAITAETMSNFIDTLNVSDSVKAELKAITPSSYTGYSESLAGE
ncbi:MAG: adenylosuccinate lyase [Crocinitomicaceae bacterium]|nr:adenylosuccinate lyase [Crocinitomicaceae bacterium]|tara:strand:- start:1971 stop:3335 length:1365 start_codon:yes stop_codon:yes gene_type:complete